MTLSSRVPAHFSCVSPLASTAPRLVRTDPEQPAERRTRRLPTVCRGTAASTDKSSARSLRVPPTPEGSIYARHPPQADTVDTVTRVTLRHESPPRTGCGIPLFQTDRAACPLFRESVTVGSRTGTGVWCSLSEGWECTRSPPDAFWLVCPSGLAVLLGAASIPLPNRRQRPVDRL